MKDVQLEQIVNVLRLHPEIEQVVLYGSRAMGNDKPGSDVDLALMGDAISLAVLSALHWELEDLHLPWKFDVAVYQHITNPDLKEHIDLFGVKLI